MTTRITELAIGKVRYPRFGWGRCDGCARYRLLFYETPDTPGRAVCAACLSRAHAQVGA